MRVLLTYRTCLFESVGVCVCVCLCVCERLTCQRSESWSWMLDARQTQSVTVWEEQVRTLAITAPRMEKGSMVYTTNTMNRKKDTCTQPQHTALHFHSIFH